MSITIYNVVSKDGFIARLDGSEDFILDSLWTYFINECKKYETIIIGAATYNSIQSYGVEFFTEFENLAIRKIIMCKDESFKTKSGYEQVTSFDELVLNEKRIILNSGPRLHEPFLERSLVESVVIVELPVFIHEGIPQFFTKPNLKEILREVIGEGERVEYEVL